MSSDTNAASDPALRNVALRDPANRVSTKAPVLWALGAAISSLLSLVALVVVDLVWLDIPWWVYPPVVLVLGAYVVVMPRVRYRIHRWESTDTAVYTQTGWLSRERRIAPMSRVQTVDFEQGPIDRAARAGQCHGHHGVGGRAVADQRDRQAGGRPAGRRPDPSYRGRGGGRDVTQRLRRSTRPGLPRPPATGPPSADRSMGRSRSRTCPGAGWTHGCCSCTRSWSW